MTLNSFLGPIVRENKIDVLSLDLNTFQSLYMWESKKAENDTSDDQTDDDEEGNDAAEERMYKTLVHRAMPHVPHLHVHQDELWEATPLRALDCIGRFPAVTLTSFWDPNQIGRSAGLVVRRRRAADFARSRSGAIIRAGKSLGEYRPYSSGSCRF